jgi:integrase/recombinase XerD
MLKVYFGDPRSLQRAQSCAAGPYLPGFACDLEASGYGRATIQDHLRTAAHVGWWIMREKLSIHELDEAIVAHFATHLSRCRCPGPRPRRRRKRAITRRALRFLAHLRKIGVTRGVAVPPRSGSQPALLTEFWTWMRHHRGVTETTLDSYGRIIVDALGALGVEPARYDVAAVRTFILDRASRHGRSKAKLVVTAMRAFLRYLTATGQCHERLDAAVPTIAQWRLAALPRYLPAAAVERVVAACQPTTPVARRNRAILLLLVHLGLRAGDIVALRLEDLDWSSATLGVAGKSRTMVRLPLPQEVGDAILAYLERGRPPQVGDRLFVRHLAPWGPLTSASISCIVGRAIRAAGVAAPSYGAHVLRHSAATAMLRQGASLEQIRTVLRHRSVETTAHYAKVDVTLLRQVAQPWPEVSPC